MSEFLIARQLTRWTAFSCGGLLLVTWRLWTPQAVFPQVPAIYWLVDAPPWIDWLCLAWLSAALICLTINPRLREKSQATFERYCFLSLFLSLSVLMALDQHRLQPWAYELWILSVVWLSFHESQMRLAWMRWILVSIYIYSACGKFDFEFLHTVGQHMLTALTGLLRFDARQLSQPVRVGLVATFPLVELAIAVGLLIPKSRRLAGGCAVLLHLGLILILGPLGLNHRPGVLVWNAQVAVQVYWLFVAPQSPANCVNNPIKQYFGPRGLGDPRGLGEWCGSIVLTLVMLLPLTERYGMWDHWTSWALYAPHSSRVLVEVSPSAIAQLPPSLRELLDQEKVGSNDEFLIWVTLPIESWSLQTLASPIYPQARYQLGIAEYIAGLVNSEFQIRATVIGPASRFTGHREQLLLEGSSTIFDAANRFWLNTHFRNYRR